MDILKPQQSDVPQDLPTPTGSLSYTDNPVVTVLKGYFQEDNPDALQFIADFYNKQNTLTSTQMLLSLRDIEHRMGMTQLGQSRAMRMYEYLKILSQIGDLQQLKQSYER